MVHPTAPIPGSLVIVVIAGVLLQASLFAQQDQSSGNNSTKRPRTGIYPLPIVFYTPETGVAGGAAALFLFRDSLAKRASSITADVIYTEKKQFISELYGDLYFDGDTYRLTADVTFQKYPNKFWGIGNNTPDLDEEGYTPRTFLFKSVLYSRISSFMNIGPAVRYSNDAIKEVTPEGALSTGRLAGSTGGTCAAAGFVANWDSRDNTFATQSGSFYQVTALFYRSVFGSDFAFDDVQIDTRNFFPVFTNHVIAIQGIGEFTSGTVPIQNYAKFGGQSLLRGYFDGRYRDNNLVAVQAEYRMPVWWRFHVVGFAGVAQVADQVSDLALNRFWFAGGLGLRFAWNPEERINVRFDYGAGSNSSGVYVTITEAF
jgi:hypothetical protein